MKSDILSLFIILDAISYILHQQTKLKRQKQNDVRYLEFLKELFYLIVDDQTKENNVIIAMRIGHIILIHYFGYHLIYFASTNKT